MLGRLVIVTSLVAQGVVPAGAQEPIRVGFLTALTGALAQPGKEMENGIQLLLQGQRFTIGGPPVQLTLLDMASNPSVALAKARELVEQQKVHVIIGPLAAFEAYAVAPFANTNRVPIISPSAAADDLTQRKATPLFVRATSTSSQPTTSRSGRMRRRRSATTSAPGRRGRASVAWLDVSVALLYPAHLGSGLTARGWPMGPE
jgi:Periplasmic binding protein